MAGARRSGWTAALLGVALAGAGCKETTCPAGQVACGGGCIVADTVDNCVYCGVRCPAGASCTPSGCQCPAGEVSCGYGQPCVSLSSDANCGACGHDCGLGTCSTTTSPPSCDCGSYTSCGPTVSPQCVDTANDAKNCGACGYDCGRGTCAGGACTCNTGTGIANCGAGTSPQCVDTLTDDRNCGGCGTVCASGWSCEQGVCCRAGLTNCSGFCRDLLTDSLDCGACGNACTDGATCSAGHCCPVGFAWCGTACVNVLTDSSNCGTCGNTCQGSQACVTGKCQCPLSAPYGCGTSCCVGSVCCNSGTSPTCQLAHSNGLGQTYYDCAALGTPGDQTTYNFQMASEAATAWSATGTYQTIICGAATCVGRLTMGTPQDCAVWCYTSTLAGFVGHSSPPTIACAAVCPFVGSPTWQ